MPNALTLKPTSSNILIVGDSGTHKTWFLGQVPRNYVFDFDRGMSINRGRDVEYDTFKEAVKGRIVTPDTTKNTGLYNYATAWPVVMSKLQQLGDSAAQNKLTYQHISLDSLTFMSDIAMNHVLSLQAPGTGIHQGSYGSQQKYIMTVLDEVTTWPVRVICTAHIQRDKNDLTGIIEKLPLLTGKLAGRISTYFDEVWYIDTEGSGSTKKYWILTEPTPDMRQAKSRLGIPNKTEFTWEAVRPYLEGTAPLKLV